MDKQHAEFDPDSDTRLLRYLAREKHWTPFAHAQISLRVSAPIFVARQLEKHYAGLVMGTAIPVRSEVSRRYVDHEPEFYTPAEWRERAENVKQGSGEAMKEQGVARMFYEQALLEAQDQYRHLLGIGICPEQARMILPQSMMTTWIWTGSLAAFARVCGLRLDSHAQSETREIAVQIAEICAIHFPVSWAALNPEK